MTTYHSAKVRSLDVFYRQAGDPANPKLLLLGGFPASSHQFRNLIPALADRFHVLSPDYPGFGNTEMPDPATWDYTFDHLAEIVDGLLDEVGFTGPMGIFMQDYGGPIGNRLIAHTRNGCSGRSSRTRTPTRKASPRPGTASDTHSGSTAAPRTRRRSRPSCSPRPSRPSTPPATRIRARSARTTGTPTSSSCPGPTPIACSSTCSTTTGPTPRSTTTWQASLRERQPLTLIFWGQGDIFFTPAGGEAYLRDLPDAELIRLDSGHFAVEDHLETIAEITCSTTPASAPSSTRWPDSSEPGSSRRRPASASLTSRGDRDGRRSSRAALAVPGQIAAG